MKVNFYTTNPVRIQFRGVQNDLKKMSGEDISQSYENKIIEDTEKNKLQKTQIISDIMPAISEMANQGKYEASIILLNEVKSTIPNEKIPAKLLNSVGKAYQNIGDIQSANNLFEIAKNNTPFIDNFEGADIYKNYIISSKILGKQTDKDEAILNKENNPIYNMAKMQIAAFEELQKENPDKKFAAKNLLITGFNANRMGLNDGKLGLGQAKIFSMVGAYNNSINICRENLDILKNNNKIYTKEFYDNLILLGSNYIHLAQKDSPHEKEYYQNALNVLSNAKSIAQQSEFKNNPEILDYLLLVGKSQILNTEMYLNDLNKFVNKTKNKNLIKNLYLLTLDSKSLDLDNNLRTEYLKKVENIVNGSIPVDQKLLMKIYSQIKSINPNMENDYNIKIDKLDNIDVKDFNTLVSVLEINYKNKNYEKIMQYQKQQEKYGLNDNICNAYKMLLNIENGKNFNDNATELKNTLDKMYNDKNRSENSVLENQLYKFYTKTGALYYSAQHYYKAFDCADKALSLAKDLKMSSQIIATNYIQTTLIKYKAKDYYSAETTCFNYLKFLLQQNPDKINVPKLTIHELQRMSGRELTQGRNESQSKNIASAIETLGIINLKNTNYADAEKFFRMGISIREQIKDKDLKLANDYAALARILIIRGAGNGIKYSKMHHENCIKALKNLTQTSTVGTILSTEEEFHKKYYGCTWASVGKYIPWRNTDSIVDNFKCYNGDLNICE